MGHGYEVGIYWGNRMSIIQSTDLEARGLLNDQSSALQIQGKWFKPGPAFTKSLLQTALDFCKDAREHGRQYLLIEFPTYFMAWQRIRPKTSPSPSQKPSTAKPAIPTQTPPPLPPKQTAQPNTPAAEPPDLSTKATLASVNRIFINRCKTELAVHVGPMADFLTEQTLKQSPHLSPQQLIEALALQIPDTTAALAFRQSLE